MRYRDRTTSAARPNKTSDKNILYARRLCVRVCCNEGALLYLSSLFCIVHCSVLFHVVNGNTVSRVLLAVVVSLSILRKITTAAYMRANILI